MLRNINIYSSYVIVILSMILMSIIQKKVFIVLAAVIVFSASMAAGVFLSGNKMQILDSFGRGNTAELHTEEQTTAICISENETLPIYQKNITDIAKLRIGNSSYNIIAIDSDGKAYEWGASLDMIESNKIDVATQTIYGDTTSVHKMEVVNKLETAIDSYYADRVLKCRVFINGKFYEINNANFDEVNEVIVTQENWVSPISEFLDGETFKTVDGTVYKIMSLELVKYYTPIQEKEYNTTIRIPGANIVSQTRYKALDDQGNLYVVGEYTGGYSSTVEPICATQGDYVVEPIYSSGNGWTQVKKVY